MTPESALLGLLADLYTERGALRAEIQQVKALLTQADQRIAACSCPEPPHAE